MGIITLTGELDETLFQSFLSEFIELEHEHNTIVLYLSSPGGNVRVAISIYDLIKSSKANVHVVVIGTCYSAANIILQGCQKRYALPHASFMVHAGSSELSETHYSEVPAAMRLDRTEMKLADALAASRCTDPTTLKRLYRRGEYFSSETAKKLGLIDDIISSRL